MMLRDVAEDALLAELLPLLPSGPDVVIGPGDDTALLRTRGSVLATTDTMVRGRDWRDDWSSAQDVGFKCVMQNAADISAMGGVTTGLLVTIVADPETTSVDWVRGFTEGVAEAAAEVGTGVIGGDLSSAGEGVLVVSITALGDLQGREPVCRDGAQPGDVVAVAGPLGRAAAGLELLLTGWRPGAAGRSGLGTEQIAARLVGEQLRPRPHLAAGPAAAAAGAHAMIDLSDGLARDAGRLARASDVRVELDHDALASFVAMIAPGVGKELAWKCVLAGGEEHTLLAAFEPANVPDGWVVVGTVIGPDPEDGPGVHHAGEEVSGLGWDHFRQSLARQRAASLAADNLTCDGDVICTDPVPVRS